MTVRMDYAAASPAGIKASGKPDLALIVRRGTESLAAAAVFTPNRFAAAPIRRSRLNLLASEPAGRGGFGYADAVVCTSGSANAATGAAGDEERKARAHDELKRWLAGDHTSNNDFRHAEAA